MPSIRSGLLPRLKAIPVEEKAMFQSPLPVRETGADKVPLAIGIEKEKMIHFGQDVTVRYFTLQNSSRLRFQPRGIPSFTLETM